MKLDSLRNQIDLIDNQMMDLFKQRMNISKAIGDLKKELGLPVLDLSREQSILEKRKADFNDDQLWPLYESFLKHLFDLSKEQQR